MTKTKEYSNYHQRIITNRVFKFLEMAGFVNSSHLKDYGQFNLKINGLDFRVIVAGDDWSFYIRTLEGKQLDIFGYSTSFSGKFRNEKEIGLFITNWIYESAYKMASLNSSKEWKDKLNNLIK